MVGCSKSVSAKCATRPAVGKAEQSFFFGHNIMGVPAIDLK